MKVNKHGIKITNLRSVSGATINNDRGYSQIDYDRSTGKLLASWHVGNSSTSWTEYHDPDVIHVCNTRRHMTMQELADAVRDALAEFESKIYNVIFGPQYAIIVAEYGISCEDITRDESDYASIKFVRNLTLSDLKLMMEEHGSEVYQYIQRYDDYWDQIETIAVYDAVTADGEELQVYVPDVW